MKKYFKISVSLLLSLIILVSGLVFSVSAAGTIISFNKNTLTVGETLSVTVSIDAGAAMYGVSCSVNYDSSVLEYKSGGGAGGAGSVKIVESPSGDTKVSYTLTFNTIKAGASSVSIVDVVCSVQGNNGSEEVGVSGASATVTVNDVTLSDNADLSSLSLSAGSLSPRFSAGTTSYTATVKNSVTKSSVYAKSADPAAKVEVSGSSTLEIGENVRTITVTAPSGAQKVYTVTIYRSETVESEPDDSSSESDEVNPLATNIEGVEYTVATDISGVTLFNGFTASTAQFNSQEVAIATDANGYYEIYYLKAPDSDVLVPYTYDATAQVFTVLPYYTQGDYTYIFTDIPEGKTVNDEDYYATTSRISGFDVNGFANQNSALKDFLYVYCYSGDAYGFYRFDTIENVMQRSPEISLVDIDSIETPDDTEDDGFLARFSSLTTNAKIIVLALALLLIAVVVLLVLLVIKFIKRKDADYFDDDEDFINDQEFDKVTYSGFSIDGENEENSAEEENTENTEA